MYLEIKIFGKDDEQSSLGFLTLTTFRIKIKTIEFIDKCDEAS